MNGLKVFFSILLVSTVAQASFFGFGSHKGEKVYPDTIEGDRQYYDCALKQGLPWDYKTGKYLVEDQCGIEPVLSEKDKCVISRNSSSRLDHFECDDAGNLRNYDGKIVLSCDYQGGCSTSAMREQDEIYEKSTNREEYERFGRSEKSVEDEDQNQDW